MFVSWKYLTILILAHSSQSLAAMTCSEIFGSPPAATAPLLLPAELHLKPEAITHLKQTVHRPLLEALAKAYGVHPFFFEYLPLTLKHAADLKDQELLPVEELPALPQINTQSDSFRRAYTAIYHLSQDAASEHSPREAYLLDHETLVVLSHLTEKLVPRQPSPEVVSSTLEKTWIQIHRVLNDLLKVRSHRDLWRDLLKKGIFLTQIGSKHNGAEGSEKYSSVERFYQIHDKLENNRSLSKQDITALGFLTFRMHSSILERLQPKYDFSMPQQVFQARRWDFLNFLIKDLERYVADETIIPSVEMFDALFFQSPMPVSEIVLRQTMIQAALPLLLKAKSDYAHWSKQQSLAAQAPASMALFSANPLVDSIPTKSRPEHRKVREKTRGLADPTKDETSVNTVSASPGPEIPSVTSPRELQPETIYLITFQRHHLHLGDPAQKFVFHENVVAWLKQNPDLGEKFLRSIKVGPINSNTGQSGIKLLQHIPKTLPGRLYEVKIFGRYRMILHFSEGLWTALDVLSKDHFDVHLRHL